jgi:hypothetical protein
MTATYRRNKPDTGRVPFGLCTIGTASLPAPDARCIACLHARPMTARAWLGVLPGTRRIVPPSRRLSRLAEGCAMTGVTLAKLFCDDWRPALITLTSGPLP